MGEKRIAIIGGGITGLAAGCYARMNGYEVDLFEQHTVAGGLCAAWKRQGYTFDGCVHWLVGSDRKGQMGRLWRELGALEDQPIWDPEIFAYTEGSNGERFHMYADPERLRGELKRVAPEDAKVIDEYCNAIQALRTRMGALMGEVSGFGALLAMLGVLPLFAKWGSKTIQQFTGRFQNQFAAWSLRSPWDLPDFTALAPVLTMGWLADHRAGYPIGGSLPLAQAIQRRAEGLGCHLHLGSRVEKVLVEGGKAVGVRLAGGAECRADYVLATGDLHTLLFDLLDGRFGQEHQSYFGQLPIFEAIGILSFGVKRTFDDLPKVSSSICLKLPETVTIAGAPHDFLHCHVFNFDPTLAPEGSTVFQVYLEPRYEDWKELAKDRARYLAEKKKVADQVAGLLEARFPGFTEQIEVVDFATPVTFERYTANWRGSFEGWMLTPKTMRMNMKRTLPGLDALYLGGQWVRPGGGLPTAAMHGREAIQTLCKRDGKKFVVTD